MENLEIASVTSDNALFSVAAPSSGYPVVISPDFCFPLQINFAPRSAGAKAATLTIDSNDPVNPSVEVDATGAGAEQSRAEHHNDHG